MKGELCLKSGYNFLSSTLKIESIVSYAKNNNYDFIGLIDDGVLYGAMEFYHTCIKENIKPIIGMEINYNNLKVCLISKNKEGYYNLIKLSKIINDKKENKNISKEDLNLYNKGLICVLPSYRAFKDLNDEEINLVINEFQDIYKDFYIGIETYNIDKSKRLNALFRGLNIKKVPFNKIVCKDKEDLVNIEYLNAIKNNEIIGIRNIKDDHEYTYFISDDEKRNNFVYEELLSYEEIVKSCNLTFKKEKLRINTYTSSKEEDEKYLKALAFAGLKKRNKDFIKNKTYVERLNYELDVIIKMGYASYFLIVYDYVKFAKNSKIVVGPGRGSGVASLVSYSIGISDVNPIEHGLLFERFLNFERVSLPDIDIDFQDNRRDEVVKYLKEKYGKSRVANIVTFSTLAARQVLRDVSKVIGLSKKDIELLSKTAHRSGAYELKKMYELSKEFKNLIDSDPKYKEVYKIALAIEGLPRQTSLHAAGIIIGDEELDNIIPVTVDNDGDYVSQYDMNYLEDLGLLKMDILGLKNLTIIDECVRKIKEIYKIDIDINKIDINDPKLYEYINTGQVSGLFQLESEGMRKTIKQVHLDSFDDLASILALYRPGPRDFIDDFCKRKNEGAHVDYIDKSLHSILKPTYGIVVYQEQLIQIVQAFAGFSLARADIFRRAISKKDVTQMESLKKDFFVGSLKKGHSKEKTNEVFSLILKFANYGFNKPHTVAYATITAQMTYLKLYYPIIFFSCVMNSFVGGGDVKFIDYVSECERSNIKLMLPNINISDMNFKPVYPNKIYYSLAHIKGVNTMFIKKVIKERNKKEFESYQDFVVRMINHKLSKAQITPLIDAGALDLFNYNRATLKHNYEKLEKYAKLISYEEDNQLKFDFNILPMPKIEVVEKDKNELLYEREMLGIFISGFPLTKYRESLKNKDEYTLIGDLEDKENKIVKIMGLIKNIKIIKTKKSKMMAIVSSFDETGEINIVIFPSLYEKVSHLINKNDYIDVLGRVQIEDNLSLIADSISKIEVEVI